MAKHHAATFFLSLLLLSVSLSCHAARHEPADHLPATQPKVLTAIQIKLFFRLICVRSFYIFSLELRVQKKAATAAVASMKDFVEEKSTKKSARWGELLWLTPTTFTPKATTTTNMLTNFTCQLRKEILIVYCNRCYVLSVLWLLLEINLIDIYASCYVRSYLLWQLLSV